jgi:hypothetical protein
LRAEGHSVTYHYNTEEGAGAHAWKQLKTNPPDVLIISLARMPSHGRRIASVILENRSPRQLPLIFVGGADDKVAKAKSQFPDAGFVDLTGLVSKLNAFEPAQIGTGFAAGAQ